MKLPKLKYYYHATPLDSAEKILACGYLKPQEHLPGESLGVYFANSQHNASMFMLQRNISEYVIFKIPRSRFDMSKMRIGGADKFPKEMNMLCVRYLGIVPVKDGEWQKYIDERELVIPGWERVIVGTKKIGWKCVDMEAFEKYIENTPQLKAMIEKELEAAE